MEAFQFSISLNFRHSFGFGSFSFRLRSSVALQFSYYQQKAQKDQINHLSLSKIRLPTKGTKGSDQPLLSVCKIILPKKGKYYIVDTGNCNTTGFLAPYCHTRYLLDAFKTSSAPQSTREIIQPMPFIVEEYCRTCFWSDKRAFPYPQNTTNVQCSITS
ncbi:uncharacterized protein LOC105421313 isoform X1 [Amborella trichopoda]|uniref:uncharacterized protein LOC105421313 isoform X1 n=1 Tax=Amborella trichopoda TaxID=13333 RepID=UPI0005D423E1|nr:uncharacterized protein LOC105421313 isoform X1 [Amborella trichopoda]|eukprot:XP_011626563.1 uncharacterized protein LOC105421313 isoform X1 [Amborella trichopoda]